MSNDSSASIVSKVWNYAHVLKNARVGYGLPVRQTGDYLPAALQAGVEVRAAPAFLTYLLLAPTFCLRADAQPCGLPVSPSARLLKLTDEMTELGFGIVAAASRRSSLSRNQRRDASATLPSDLQRVIKMIAAAFSGKLAIQP